MKIRELGIGDIIRPQRSSNRYRVTRFEEITPEDVRVQLEPAEVAGPQIVRSARQVWRNWRLVERAPEP